MFKNNEYKQFYFNKTLTINMKLKKTSKELNIEVFLAMFGIESF